MDTLKQKKTDEAKQHIADAEKSLKTSLFKRKPDYDSAASSYNSAGTCYKVSKDLNNAIECFKKSAECYNQNKSLYHAAKQFEQVGFLANEMKNYALTYESIVQAADLMLTDGTRDSAGIILERAANMLKINDPEKALILYKKVIYISDVEDKNHEMVVFYEQAISIALKLEKFNEALELIGNVLKVLDNIGTVEQITKYILSIVIIHLNREDWVSAKSYLDTCQKKYEGKFGRVDDLIEAYDQKDDEKLKSIIKNYLSYAVDNEILKIANKIVKSEEWIKEVNKNASTKEQNVAAKSDTVRSQTGQNNLNEENDDFDDLK